MKTIHPTPETARQTYQYLNATVGPRPIALASTLDADGNVNLAPFSYFNVFGIKPPILVFSPVISLRTGAAKDTLLNIEETREVVINMVAYNMVQQMSLTSAPFPRGISEFEKAGFTPIASERVQPMRVKESPVQFECKVLDIVRPSVGGGAGQLIIAEVVAMHLADHILDENGIPTSNRLDLVARMGGNYYCRAYGDALFELPPPKTNDIIAWDGLPKSVRESDILTGSQLGILASASQLPEAAEIEATAKSETIVKLLQTAKAGGKTPQQALHHYAAKLINEQKINEAWAVLLAAEKC